MVAKSVDGSSPADWMLLADSSLGAFLRMLSDLPDPDTVAEAIARGPLSPFQPALVAIGFIRVQRDTLSIVGAFGLERELRHQYQEVPLTADLPATVCYRTNDVVTTPSSRMAEDFPLVAPYVNAAAVPPDGVATSFPLRHRGAVVGVLGVEVSQPPVEPWYLRSAVSVLSGPLALWSVLRMQLDDGHEAYWSRRPTRALTVTDRQQQILTLVRQGLTNPQIAAEIGFSIPTVKSELARLSQLFGATSREELAQKAARAGL
ncbi:MAG TPA: helix-turn-helix transcriptional regulator [Candidatus Nanopelagicales bacterium]